jgi:antirestriction protein
MSDTEAELREVHGDDAVDAFIEIWSVDDLDYFEDAYCGEFESGAAFAEDLVTGSFGIDNLPTFVALDWNETWNNLRYDYQEQDGFIFNANW